jgi:hypothetical protein
VKCCVLVFAFAVIAAPAFADSGAVPAVADSEMGGHQFDMPRIATGMPRPLNRELARYYRDQRQAVTLPGKTTEPLPKAGPRNP